jgi:hypothetical protein
VYKRYTVGDTIYCGVKCRSCGPVGVLMVLEEQLHGAVERSVNGEPRLLYGDAHEAVPLTPAIHIVGQVRLIPGGGGVGKRRHKKKLRMCSLHKRNLFTRNN